MRALIFSAFIGLCCGCQYCHYNKTGTGEFHGVAKVQWISADYFVFIPETDPNCEFYFVRPNGERITPKLMFTDGGSIPRGLWDKRAYSPWGYGPAFLIHDWIFDAHRRHEPGEKNYSLEEAAEIMSEATKTLMTMLDERTHEPKVPQDKWALYLQYIAVKSSFARKAWDAEPVDDPHDELCGSVRAEIEQLLETRPERVPAQLQQPLRMKLGMPEAPAFVPPRPSTAPSSAPVSPKWK